MDRSFVSGIGMVMVVAACGCNTETADSTSGSDQAEQAASSTEVAGQVSRLLDDSQRLGDSSPELAEKQGQYVSFPAVGVKIVPPDGFEDAEGFYGFQQPATQSSVMIMKIPGPFSETAQGFTDAEQLSSRGMTLRSTTDVQIDGDAGILVSLTQTAYGTEFAKWVLAFGDDKATTMVTATFPASADRALSERLKSAVLSTQSDGTSAGNLHADVGFTIVASEKLKPTPGIGKMLLYTLGGEVPAKSPLDPMFVAAPSFSAIPSGDKRQFAIERIHHTANTSIRSITSNEEITIDEMRGYELVAEAEDDDSGAPMAVYLVVLFEGESYFLMQGLVGAHRASEYVPEFRSMARSLRRAGT